MDDIAILGRRAFSLITAAPIYGRDISAERHMIFAAFARAQNASLLVAGNLFLLQKAISRRLISRYAVEFRAMFHELLGRIVDIDNAIETESFARATWLQDGSKTHTATISRIVMPTLLTALMSRHLHRSRTKNREPISSGVGPGRRPRPAYIAAFSRHDD